MDRLDPIMDRIETVLANIKANPVIWTAVFLALLIVSTGLLIITIVSMIAPASAFLGMTILTVLAFGILGLMVAHEIAEDLVNKVQKH